MKLYFVSIILGAGLGALGQSCMKFTAHYETKSPTSLDKEDADLDSSYQKQMEFAKMLSRNRDANICSDLMSRWLVDDSTAALKWIINQLENDQQFITEVFRKTNDQHADKIVNFTFEQPQSAEILRPFIDDLIYGGAYTLSTENAGVKLLDQQYHEIFTAILKSGSIDEGAVYLNSVSKDERVLAIMCGSLLKHLQYLPNSFVELPANAYEKVKKELVNQIIRQNIRDQPEKIIDLVFSGEGQKEFSPERKFVIQSQIKQPSSLVKYLSAEKYRGKVTKNTILDIYVETAKTGTLKIAREMIKIGYQVPDLNTLMKATREAPALLELLSELAPGSFDRTLFRQLASFNRMAADRLVSKASEDQKVDLILASKILGPAEDVEKFIREIAANDPIPQSAAALLGDIAKQNPSAAWQIACALPEGQSKEWSLVAVAPEAVFLNPQDIFDKLHKLPEGLTKDSAWSGVGIAYGKEDPRGATIILSQMLNDGILNQKFLSGYLLNSSDKDTHSAAVWLGKVNDENEQKALANSIMNSGKVDRYQFMSELEAANLSRLLK